jgi:hypothetical protein
MNKSLMIPAVSDKILEVRTKIADPTAKQVEKVNQFTLRTYSAEELYVRQQLLCNDQYDRHHEKFDEGYLKRISQTIIGKSVLMGHDKHAAGVARYFDSKVLTEDDGWKWCAPWFYMPISEGNKLERDNIDSGVWSYVSVGVRPDWRGLVCDLCGEQYYYGKCEHYQGDEYDGKVCTCTFTTSKSDMQKVEAVEGSIVYLGAQYNAAIKKDAEAREDARKTKESFLVNLNLTGGPNMDELTKVQAELDKVKGERDTLSTEKSGLEARVKDGDTAKTFIRDEVKRLAESLGQPLVAKTIDKVEDSAELIELYKSLTEEWSKKHAPSGQAEGDTGEDGATVKTVNPVTARSYEL